jgi:hypothetical protein
MEEAEDALVFSACALAKNPASSHLEAKTCNWYWSLTTA